jgi:hypothetical protein
VTDSSCRDGPAMTIVCSDVRLARARNFSTPVPLSGRGWAISGVKAEMSDNYIIEVGSRAAGIVVRNPDGYRFFAADHRFSALEGQLFRNAREAERAAIRLANKGLTLAA